MERIQHKSVEISGFMLSQSFQHGASSRKNLCHNISFRIHNKEQQNLCRNKDYFCRDEQNMRAVNSLWRQEIEGQHKRNGDKEIHVASQ